MKDYQTTKNFFRSLNEMTSEERRQVSDFMQKLKDENEEEKFVYYDNVSDLKRNFVFDYQKLQNETGILYIDYINLSIRKYSENFEKINHLFKMVKYGTRMLNDGLINITLDKNENARYFTTDYVEEGFQAIEETTDVIDDAKEEFKKNIDEILSYLYVLLENEKINVFKNLKPTSPETFEMPENDYSGKNELKPKEKLIILDKLGVVEFLTDKLNVSDNATHLAEILGAITGIDNQKGTLTGYCNYLIRPDHGNKNSPYFSETTVKKANQIYNTFNITDKTD